MKTSRKASKKLDEYLDSPMGLVERGRKQMFNEIMGFLNKHNSFECLSIGNMLCNHFLWSKSGNKITPYANSLKLYVGGLSDKV